MEKAQKQIERDISASFGYVKKDMLMLNDAFSDLHDKVQHLSLNHAILLEEITKLREELTEKKIIKKTSKKRDDLTRIEGIGSAIKKFLWNKNIDTFKKLSNKTPEELRDILEKDGSKFQMHNPSTWPRQAKLASAGEWKELKVLQEKLIGGLFEKKNGEKTPVKKKK